MSSHFTQRTMSAAIRAIAFTALAAMGSASAQVTPGATGIDATGNAQSEMAACNNGKTQQDRETCMREVRNANAEKRAGKLDGSSTRLDANAMQRCDALTGDDKIACRARVAGYGNTSGSVGSGGVIRQVETVVVPADASSVTIQPKTNADNIIVIPAVK
ncbi:MAG: hypothetical protein JWP47_406 [Polaromonas sp.]|jgi:hypothetical protein|nr:hypothetical protein [Polaromonas sp.]